VTVDARKRVVIELPPRGELGDPIHRHEPELEIFGSSVDLVEIDSSTVETFVAGAADADAIIATWGIKLTRPIIERLDRCVIIALASVGVDMVDVAAATDAGIVVTNVPDVFIEEVADHTLTMLLASHRRLRRMEELIGTGNWAQGWPELSRIPRLYGQTLGLISFGNVARAVARRASAFGLHVIAYDPYVSELKMTAEGVEPVSLRELLQRSDFVSIHAPHNAETHHMLTTEHFALMKPSAVFINCGRGSTVDEAALAEALRAGQIAAAGLDVLEQEPPDPANPLLAMDNVVLTPHVASATSRMRPTARRRAAREVALVLSGRWPMSCVNPTVLPRTPLERWQPYSMDRGPSR
jgi:D-3-phosphoglycerate dehydrogenase